MKSPKRSGPRALEAEETLDAIRRGQVDALVIQGADADAVYALRSFEEIERAQTELRNAGTERRRTNAQLKTLLRERERLFQDLHDGCIQSIYAVGLTLEAAMNLCETKPREVRAMLGDSVAGLNLVMQDLRSVLTGHQLQLGPGRDLRSEIESTARSAGNSGLAFAVEIDADALSALTDKQSLQLFQIARECISNAVRHSGARTGRISLHKEEGAVHFEVSDDGVGFAVEQAIGLGFGLHHIDARARSMGTRACIISAPNKGTRVRLRIGKESASRRRPRS